MLECNYSHCSQEGDEVHAPRFEPMGWDWQGLQCPRWASHGILGTRTYITLCYKRRYVSTHAWPPHTCKHQLQHFARSNVRGKVSAVMLFQQQLSLRGRNDKLLDTLM